MKTVIKPITEIKKELIENMKSTIGAKKPIEYFNYLTDAIAILFEENTSLNKRMQSLQDQLCKIKIQTALSVHWEPKVALSMLASKIEEFRMDKDSYINELDSFKKAYSEDRVTQNYHDFVRFWIDNLGYHPFLE